MSWWRVTSNPTCWRSRRTRGTSVTRSRSPGARGPAGPAPSSLRGPVGAPAARPCCPLSPRAPLRRRARVRRGRAALPRGAARPPGGPAARRRRRPRPPRDRAARGRAAHRTSRAPGRLRGDGFALPRRHVRWPGDGGRTAPRRHRRDQPGMPVRLHVLRLGPGRAEPGARVPLARLHGELDWIDGSGYRTSTSSTPTTACAGATWTSCARSGDFGLPPASRATCSST